MYSPFSSPSAARCRVSVMDEPIISVRPPTYMYTFPSASDRVSSVPLSKRKPGSPSTAYTPSTVRCSCSGLPRDISPTRSRPSSSMAASGTGARVAAGSASRAGDASASAGGSVTAGGTVAASAAASTASSPPNSQSRNPPALAGIASPSANTSASAVARANRLVKWVSLIMPPWAGAPTRRYAIRSYFQFLTAFAGVIQRSEKPRLHNLTQYTL